MREQFTLSIFGVPAAERDNDLSACFVSSNVYDSLRQGQKTIVLGNRGSGKSALFRMIAEEERKSGNSVIALAPEEYSYELLSEIMKKEAQGAWAKQGAYSAAWKYLILILIPTTLFNVLSNYLSSAFCDETNTHDGFDAEPRKLDQVKNPRFVSSSAVEV